MKIRPRNIPKFVGGGPATVNYTDPTSNWFTRSGDFGILEGTYNILKPLYDKWKSSGSLEDYLAYKKAVEDLNNDLRFGYAPGHLRYESNGNNLFIGNGTKNWQNTIINKYGFINNSIGNNFDKYHIVSPNPTSGDRRWTWNPDNYWAGITNDRTTFGFLDNENNPLYQKWKQKFSEIGIDYKTGPNEWNTNNVLYGFLNGNHFKNSPKLPLVDRNAFSRSLLNTKTTPQIKIDTGGEVNALEKVDKESFADKLRAGLKNIDVAGLIDGVRLAGNLINNQRVYDIVNKSIRPALLSTYRTHRQVVGDEATKLAYYRRAAQGQTRAAKPFTSDADRLMAYQFEAKRVGDELRAQGDLADNQEIRRTSDESNQHQWDNIRRATDVANQNKIAMLDALAKKAQLLAQKESSDWTNIDLFLLGKQAKMEQNKAEEKAWNKQLTELLAQQNLLNDEELLKLDLDRLDAYTAWENAKPEEKETLKNKVTEANKKYQNRLLELRRLAIQLYRESIGSYKSGSKLEYKYKDNTDKYLYKTSRDIVEHFRKMSKMTDDSRIRSREKKIKLEPHPRGNTRKYLLGGLAPFTIYRPLGVGGESAVSSQVSSSTGNNSSSEKKSDKEKDKLDLAKKLFESLKGLPVDVNMAYKEIFSVFNKAKMFGEDLSTDDIASLYLSSMLKLNTLLHSQEAFKNATTNVTAKDGLQEYAVAADGRVVVQNLDTVKIEYKKLEDILNSKGKYNPLTNNQLLQLRAHSPELAFDDNILNVVNAGIGINKIGAEIKSLAGTIGSSENKLEGISQVEANNIRAGLQILAGTDGTPDGYYQVTNESKDSKAKVVAALRYIESVLPESYKTILKLHGGPNIETTIAGYLSSGTSDYSKLSIAPLTGKASKDSNGSGANKDGSGGLKFDAATALISGKGYLGNIEFNPGTSYAVTVNARHSGFLNKSGENMGSGITMLEATTSTLDQVLDWNKATLGGSRINPTGYNRVMINNDDVVGVDLPVGKDKNTPDFTMLLKLQILDLELLKRGIEDTPNNFKQVNEICLKIGLPAKYKNDGSLNNYSWNRFAAFLVTADDSVLINKNAILEDILGIVEDDNIRELYELIILKDNKNYKLGSGFLGLGKQALYLGTVFVPIKSNYVASALSGGLNISMSLATDLELRERGYDLSKVATYKPAININEL